MSAFKSNVDIHEGSWLMAELSVLSDKCPHIVKNTMMNEETNSIRLFIKKQARWEPIHVKLPDNYIKQGLVDIELACALLHSNNGTSSTCLPSIDDIKSFHQAHSNLSWRMLLGPLLNRQPQWVVANQSGEYYMWMKNSYGENRIVATCSPNTSRLQTAYFGITSLGFINGVYSWELTKYAALTPIDLLLPHDEETDCISLIVSNPEFCDRFSGITIALLEEEALLPPTGRTLSPSDNVEDDIVGVKSPLNQFRNRAKSTPLESIVAAIGASQAEERGSDEEEATDSFNELGGGFLNDKIDKEDAELVDGILSGQPVDVGWPLVGYAQFCILGSWVEIGHVILSIERSMQENEKGSFDMIFINKLVLTCVSSGVRILSTLITHTISMMQRDTSVRWLSPNDMGLTNIVIVDFVSDSSATILCNTIANTLGLKPVRQYALLPNGRLKEHSLSEIPKSDTVTIMTSGSDETSGSGGTPSMIGHGRPSLFKSATNRIRALNLTVRSFRHALEVARERKGLMTLARACGMASRTERMLQDGDFSEARQLVLLQSKRKNSVEVEHVVGLSINELHLEATPFAHGGSGNIFKGMLGTEQVVAKCMIESDMDSNKQLLNEVRILSSLQHVNIIRVFGVAEADQKEEAGLWYLVEEYADRGDLSDFIFADHYTPAMFAQTTLELLQAIRFMHSHLICHLDLKLENVLLKGKSFTVKVADFGTSKHNKLDAGIEESSSGSEEEQVAGTICYMPPETFEESHKKDKLSSEFAWDCYSLAIMLWAMWERKLPWAGMGVCQVFNNVTKGRRPKFSSGTLPPAPSPELRLLVTSMWNKHPQNRPEIEDILQSFSSNVAPQLKLLMKQDDWHGSHTDSHHRDSLALNTFPPPSSETGAEAPAFKAIVRVAEYPPYMETPPPPLPEDALVYI